MRKAMRGGKPAALGLYVHIPFCLSKCDYCDFYSLAGRSEWMDAYQKALMAHLTEAAPYAREHVVDTVYFGGGTPSHYGARRLCELLGHIKKQFKVSPGAEITVECNPESVDKKGIKRLRRAGVNRISLGVQSASESDLVGLRRAHTFTQVQDAVTAIRAAGIKNLSLDLIYGLPGQTQERWNDSLTHALGLAPDHISCYGLKVEEGTPLFERVEHGERLPDDDAQADMYLHTVARLAAAGYGQYEISNFSKAGFSSRHNMKYWLGQEYIGFGPGAHSDFGTRRYAFVRDLEGYIGGVAGGGRIIEEEELLPERARGGEYLMLRLRTASGIEEAEYCRKYGMEFGRIAEKLAQYAARGLAAQVDGRWRLTPEGFLLSNRLIGELLALQEETTFRTTLQRITNARKE